MDPVTLSLAGLTSAATVLSMILVLRTLRGRRDPWGDNPWGTDVIVDDTLTYSPSVLLESRAARTVTGSWMRRNRLQRTRRIVTDALPSQRMMPRQHTFDAPPPPGTY